jgi:hypothetical protein
MEFVQKLARVVKLCKVEEVLIELGPNAPMRITLDFEGVCLTFYLAPVLVE